MLLSHFLFPTPYREQLLALQTVLVTAAPRLEGFHTATAIVTLLYILGVTEMDSVLVPTVLHHVAVFVAVMSEFYFPEWRCSCWVLLGWSMRWMNPSNLYAPGLIGALRAVCRCVLFGAVSYTNFSVAKSVRWCWIFLVHESFCLLVPIQMLYEVYVLRQDHSQIV